MSEATPTIYKGLVGVYADVSAVSKVMPETNSLTYRGYAVQDLCEESNFEEVAYLLWHGELPSAAELEAFRASERAGRALQPNVRAAIDLLAALDVAEQRVRQAYEDAAPTIVARLAAAREKLAPLAR